MFNKHMAFIKKAQKSPEELANLLCQDKCDFCVLEKGNCKILGSPCKKGITQFLKRVSMNPKPVLIVGDILTMQDKSQFCYLGDNELIEIIETTGKTYGIKKILSKCEDEIVRIERFMVPATYPNMANPQKVVVWEAE